MLANNNKKLFNFFLNSKKKSNNVRQFFSYDNWYRVEKERAERIKKQSDDLLKGKSIFDLFKFVGSLGLKEAKEFYKELRESSAEKYFFFKVFNSTYGGAFFTENWDLDSTSLSKSTTISDTNTLLPLL
jgi:hypothetical protein